MSKWWWHKNGDLIKNTSVSWETIVYSSVPLFKPSLLILHVNYWADGSHLHFQISWWFSELQLEKKIQLLNRDELLGKLLKDSKDESTESFFHIQFSYTSIYYFKQKHLLYCHYSKAFLKAGKEFFKKMPDFINIPVSKQML